MSQPPKLVDARTTDINDETFGCQKDNERDPGTNVTHITVEIPAFSIDFA